MVSSPNFDPLPIPWFSFRCALLCFSTSQFPLGLVASYNTATAARGPQRLSLPFMGSGTTPAGESPGVADADASPPVHKHVEPPTPDKARFAYLTACSDASEKCAATLPAIRQYAGLRISGYDPETSWSSYAKSIWLAACSRNIDLASYFYWIFQ